MAKFLVIVESPTKAKTISNILGKDYDVTSSMGHIVDLPASQLGVNVEKGFAPSYKIINGKEKTVKSLQKKAKNKEVVYLATDHDREGEAISWHIKEVLAQQNDNFKRVAFYEITKSAIIEAFQSPVDLDDNKVNAQKVRRILDRIVGYHLSPLLWKKIVRGLSAGRVQSVALKFIVEREAEIKKFIPVVTYEIEANFNFQDTVFKTKLKKYNGKNAIFDKKQLAQEAADELKGKDFEVFQIKRRQSKRKPASPYTTSLLQQDSFNKLKFSSKKTMLLAQHLYEGVEINDVMTGLITYMRTDSFRIADKAKKEIKAFVSEQFGKDYICAKDYKYKEKKGAQLAHEAIRPTDIRLTPSLLKDYLKPDELRLYELIWKRTIACFMKEAVIESLSFMIGDEKTYFTAEAKKVLFDGFLKVTGKEDDKTVPISEEGQKLKLEDIETIEKSTKPPARFTDASLVKILEDKGIGRPSTYTPTISTLIMRNYIRREKGSFTPTGLGIKVSSFLVEKFPKIMDEGFTAFVEEKLDGVEEGTVDGIEFLKEFYPSFKQKVEAVSKVVKKVVELVDKTCPKCGKQLAIKWSRKGRFLSCSGFPACKYAESISTGVICPECKQGKLVERRNKRGQFFYGCSKFPECHFTSRNLPKEEKKDSDSDSENKQL